MRKMLLSLSTGYVGTGSKQAWLIPDEVTQDELDETAHEFALEHAERYGIYPYPDDDLEDSLGSGSFSDNISGYFREFKDSDRPKVIYGAQRDVYWNTW